jgi:hypothetical protein
MDDPHQLDWTMAKRLSISPDELTYYNTVKSLAESLDGMTICHWSTAPQSPTLPNLMQCRMMYILAPFLTTHKIPFDKSPFSPSHMSELLVLLQKKAINGKQSPY